jgi:hypothetical protein
MNLIERINALIKKSERPSFMNEMSNYRKIDSGLPVNVWIDDEMYWKNTKHNLPRLKMQSTYGNNVDKNNPITITIEVEPKVFNRNSRQEIKDKDVEIVRRFVKKFHVQLLRLAIMDINYSLKMFMKEVDDKGIN